MNQSEVLNRIKQERKRQDVVHPDNHISEYPSILVEEVLEVIRALQGEGKIQEELIHVAAVCCRWLEAYD